MFDNIGGKIKGLAKVIFIISACFIVLLGIILMTSLQMYGSFYSLIFGLIFMAIGILFSWISSWFLYGFGQLIENSDVLVKESKKQTNVLQRLASENDKNQNFNTNNGQGNASGTHYCTYCGAILKGKFCTTCGKDNSIF